MKTDLFQPCGHCWVFQICWHIECSIFTASSFRIWNSSTGILLPPLALFIVVLPKAHLTSHSRISGSRWVITPLWLSGSWSLLYSSMYSCHLFLIFSAYVRFLSSLSFTVPILTWNVPLISPIFLKTSRVFPILLFSSVSLYCSFAKLSYIFFLLSGTLHSVRYIFPFLPCFLLPFFSSAICKASSDNHFAFLHFFFFGMVLETGL